MQVLESVIGEAGSILSEVGESPFMAGEVKSIVISVSIDVIGQSALLEHSLLNSGTFEGCPSVLGSQTNVHQSIPAIGSRDP
jgi:hypothetical protein